MGRCLWELQFWETPAQGRGWGPPNASQGRPGVLGAAHGPPSPAEPQCPRCSSSPSSCPLVPAGRPRQRGEREVRGAGPWHFWPHPQMGNFSLLHQFCLNLKRRWRHPPPSPARLGSVPQGHRARSWHRIPCTRGFVPRSLCQGMGGTGWEKYEILPPAPAPGRAQRCSLAAPWAGSGRRGPRGGLSPKRSGHPGSPS